MNPKLKLIASFAATSIFAWRVVVRETIGIGMVWGAYFIAQILLTDPAMKTELPGWLASFFPLLFWPTVALSGLSFAVASLKSAILPAIAWIAACVLGVAGLWSPAYVALFLANAGTCLFVVGFALHGGNIRAVSRQTQSNVVVQFKR